MGFLREMYGSGLNQNDPRALMVEAMIAALDADGDVADSEVDRLHELLEKHEAFAGLPADTRARLVDQAADAVEGSGGWRERLPVIARGLTTHADRITAYCLAAEIAVADDKLVEAEITYLERLQEALGLPDEEARELFESVRKRSSVMTAEERIGRMREMIPRFLDAMALMAHADGEVTAAERAAIVVVAQRLVSRRAFPDGEARAAVDAAVARVAGQPAAEIIASLAATLGSYVDRFWTVASAMIVALADGKRDWHELALLVQLQQALGLTAAQMDKAMEIATQIHQRPAQV